MTEQYETPGGGGGTLGISGWGCAAGALKPLAHIWQYPPPPPVLDWIMVFFVDAIFSRWILRIWLVSFLIVLTSTFCRKNNTILDLSKWIEVSCTTRLKGQGCGN